MQENVVIVVDYSIHAESIVKYYLERLHRPGNRLVLVHCIQLPELSVSKARDNHMSPGILAQLWADEESKRKDLEDRMREYLSANKVPGILRSASGRPGEVICRIVEEVNAAYVVAGDDLPSYGVSRVWRAVISSGSGHHGCLTDYLLHHLTCPVLVYHHVHVPVFQSHKMPSDSRQRHFSGDAIATLTSRLRRIRFASGSSGVTALRCAGLSISSIASEQCHLMSDSISDT